MCNNSSGACVWFVSRQEQRVTRNMRGIVRSMHEQLSTSDLMHLQSVLRQTGADLGRIRVGTFFSGCDMCMFALECLIGFWHDSYGSKFVFSHEFSVEIDQWKRQFIKAHWKPKRLFVDVLQLAKQERRSCVLANNRFHVARSITRYANDRHLYD